MTYHQYSSSSRATSKLSNSDEVVSDLLLELREKAKSVDADALILTDKNIKMTKYFRRSTSDPIMYRYHIQYTAELIKNCQEVEFSSKKLAKYNHLGRKMIQILDSKTRVSFEDAQLNRVDEFQLNSVDVVRSKKKINDVMIQSNEISIENGLYGVQLEDSYQKVVDKLGVPSAIINIMEDELIIGYGRRHWLHFQLNKLVKVQTTTSLLSQTTLNKIPLDDFFDSDAWKINNRVTIKMSLIETLRLLKLDTHLNQENQLVYMQSGKTLKLNFSQSTNSHTKETSYSLEGFILQVDNYQESENIASIAFKDQLKIIDKMYKQLELEQDVDAKLLREQLGEPIVQLALNKDSTLEIFNPFLMLETKKSDIKKVHLNQVSLLNEEFVDKNIWVLGKFISGTPRGQLTKYFPKNIYESYDEVEIQADNYKLSLLFDNEHNSSPLNGAKLSVWF